MLQGDWKHLDPNHSLPSPPVCLPLYKQGWAGLACMSLGYCQSSWQAYPSPQSSTGRFSHYLLFSWQESSWSCSCLVLLIGRLGKSSCGSCWTTRSQTKYSPSVVCAQVSGEYGKEVSLQGEKKSNPVMAWWWDKPKGLPGWGLRESQIKK